MQPVPVIGLREIISYNAQNKPQIVDATKKDQQGADVPIIAVTLNKYDEDTGQIKRSVVHEVDVARLTAERDRLLAQAQVITDFLATVPKP